MDTETGIPFAKNNDKKQVKFGWTVDLVPNARNKSAEFFFNVFKFDAINCSLNFIVFGL